MKLAKCAYPIAAVAATGLLVACADREVFDRVGPRSDVAADAAWPRLADTPTPPPLGVYTEDAPDPAIGDQMQIEAAVDAERAERRRAAVEGPVE